MFSSNLTVSNKDIRWILHKYRDAFDTFRDQNVKKACRNPKWILSEEYSIPEPNYTH